MTSTLTAPARLGTDPAAAPITLAVLDMAGTTITDDGLVEQAFLAANDAEHLATDDASLADMLQYVRDTMGYSKIVVFRHLTDGDEERAQRANAAFEKAYQQIVADGAAEEIPGARATMDALRTAGVKIAMTTGFAVETQTALLDALGWSDIADVTLTPAEAGRGRPFPDMALAALIATQTESVANMIVVGDTANDILTGIRSGAAAAIGVLTGAHNEHQLRAAGATHVLSSIAELPALLGIPID